MNTRERGALTAQNLIDLADFIELQFQNLDGFHMRNEYEDGDLTDAYHYCFGGAQTSTKSAVIGRLRRTADLIKEELETERAAELAAS